MGIIALLVLFVFAPVAQSACSDNKDCTACTSSSVLLTNCRWCEISQSCHTFGSLYNECTTCDDSSISKLCIVTDASQCDRNTNNSKSGKFEPSEAFNAAIYSAIAYSDQPIKCAEKLFPDDSFEIVDFVGRKCSYAYKYKQCFAYVAVSHKMKMIVLAYRGTTSFEQLVEEIKTATTNDMVSNVGGGKVQEYFSNANDKLYQCMQASMKDMVSNYPSYRVVITGHSLGGAIASIASAQLSFNKLIDKEKTTLYTFGMPRTGDVAYAKKHDELVPNSWRIVHFRDVVPKLPTKTLSSKSPYHHQREIFYGEEMSVTTDYIECFDYEDDDCANSLLLSLSSIDYHKVYYGLQLGSYCDEKLSTRRRRSDEPSYLSHLFNNETCKRIKVSDITSSSVDVSAAKTIGLMLSLLVFENLLKLAEY